nr:glycosyltransferase family 4 protein [Leifsonia sp. Leaf325]
MRIRIATRIYQPEAAAAAFRLRALAEALVANGHEVEVLTSAAPAGLAPDADGAVRVRRAPVLRDSRGQLRGYVQYLSFDGPLLFRLLFSRRADAVVVEPPPTTGVVVRLAAALRREPYVYYAADVWSDAAATAGSPAWVVRVLRAFERAAYRGARSVIAVSDGVAERVRDISGRDHVVVVRNGVDTTVFTPDGAQHDATDAGSAQRPTIVYAGTTSEWQGADVFVRAMPRILEGVPDARLVYVGQGTAWEDLRALAARTAPDSIDFVGPVPPAEAAVRLRTAQVGAVSLTPGQGYDFAVPTKIFAALACGTPVLFAGTGPSAGIVTGPLGRSVSWDPVAVADGIAALLLEAAESSDVDRAQARHDRARWAIDNASIAATGRGAASVVEAVARTGSAGKGAAS